MTKRAIKTGRVRAAPVAMAVRWTPAKRDAFLTMLVETANVAGAARAVGVPESSPYKLRARDAEFNAAWDAALDAAYSKLELMLLRRATFGDACDGADTPAISSSFALALLRHHHTRAKRGEPNLPRPVRGGKLRDRLASKLIELNRTDDDDDA